MSKAYMTSPSRRSLESLASDPSTDDFDNLPYPQPLQRSAFLSPDFSPSAYLSTLQNRHQTLSDLRAELRTRSQTLAKELLDLVNDEYQAFLHLGADLRGGEEKVEEVRVGVLGFVKGIGQIKAAVETRREVVSGLVKERVQIKQDKEVAYGLIEVHTQIGELEEALAVTENDDDDDAEEDSDIDEEEEEREDLVGVGRLHRLVTTYLRVQQQVESIGAKHPFLIKQEQRLLGLRATLLLDLSTALKQAKGLGQAGQVALFRLISLYGKMDAQKEAIMVLKQLSR